MDVPLLRLSSRLTGIIVKSFTNLLCHDSSFTAITMGSTAPPLPDAFKIENQDFYFISKHNIITCKNSSSISVNFEALKSSPIKANKNYCFEFCKICTLIWHLCIISLSSCKWMMGKNEFNWIEFLSAIFIRVFIREQFHFLDFRISNDLLTSKLLIANHF